MSIIDKANETTLGLDRSASVIWRQALFAAATDEAFGLASQIRDMKYAMDWFREQDRQMDAAQEDKAVETLQAIQTQMNEILQALFSAFQKSDAR